MRNREKYMLGFLFVLNTLGVYYSHWFWTVTAVMILVLIGLSKLKKYDNE